MKPLQNYLIGTASWYFGFGVQSVMFAWLVTLVLRESPQMVGVAQMALLIPATLFMLIGGSLADRFGGRTVVIVAQIVALLPPVALIIVLITEQLSFGFMIGYAVVMGLAQAFVTPARDGLLNDVAEGRVQRTVVQTSMIQFGAQLVGYSIAGFAEGVGGPPVIIAQVLVLVFGIVAFSRIPPAPRHSAHGPEQSLVHALVTSIVEGARTVMRSPPMRAVALQNVAMGLFFMGSFIVTIPLLVREVYAGTSADLAMVSAFNSLGLVVTILMLLRFGDVRRQGRALLLAQGVGAVALATAGSGLPFPALILCIFAWGACGGVGMSMSRTIMQEQAPANQRGRVMAFFSFSFMGAGPLGALLNGYLVEWNGPGLTLTISSAAMLLVVIGMRFTTSLWHTDFHFGESADETSD